MDLPWPREEAMITSILSKNLKGLPDFETKLERLTLLCGPNGAGKTARAHALQLAILGFCPGLAKTNAAIMQTFGSGDKLDVQIVRDGTRCSRRWTQSADGKVSELFQINMKRATRDQYAVAIGGVKLFDLGAFQKLSDQGKIDLIFSLFPPDGDFQSISDAVESKKKEKNFLQTKIENRKSTIQTLATTRSEIQLPAGNLAEVKTQIAEAESQLRMASELLHQQNVDRAKEDARKAAEDRAEALRITEVDRRAEKDRIREEQAKETALRATTEIGRGFAPKPEEPRTGAYYAAMQDAAGLPESASTPWMMNLEDHKAFVQRILDTMQRTGCSTCAASLVCRRELRKQEGTNG